MSIASYKFLPSLARSALEKNLADATIEINTDDNLEPELKDYKCEVTSGSLRIGAVSAPIYNAHEKMKVPDVLFYDNIQHMLVMEDMLKDFLLGEHLLLVGNQLNFGALSVSFSELLPSSEWPETQRLLASQQQTSMEDRVDQDYTELGHEE
ncbi:von Willebrand factor A domain-containing protein 8 [Saguinus oedipus]|uniref:von Willebrand factor A domain-containing protein 8 n=1 Tax=Saguinus oedipus TaxID=9490 RepID=A0ABQ9VTM9_SAGOE|nr:von Willebrand factor A domain-containing protein 8 [Saguinus oedipus]